MIPNGSEGRTVRVREILDDPDPSSILMISENAMTELTQEQRHEQALEKYKLDAPELMDEIKDLSPDDQKDQIQWAFEDEAEAQGLQPWELTLKYTAPLKSLRPSAWSCTRRRPRCWASSGTSTAR